MANRSKSDGEDLQAAAFSTTKGRRRGRRSGGLALAVLGLSIAALVLPAKPASAENCEEGLAIMLVDGEWVWAENVCVYGGSSTPGGSGAGNDKAIPVDEPKVKVKDPPPDPPSEDDGQTPTQPSPCDDVGNTALDACMKRAEEFCSVLGVTAGFLIGPKVSKSGDGPVGIAAYWMCRGAYALVCQHIAQDDIEACRTGTCGTFPWAWCWSSDPEKSDPGLGPPITQPESDSYWDKHH